MTLSGFAFAWAAAAGSGLPWAAAGWAVIAIGAVAALISVRAALRTQPNGADPPADVMRRFGLVNLAQAIAIAVVVAALVVADAVAMIPPAVCLIVGLHFVPLAPAFGQPLYRRLAVELGVIAVAGFVVAVAWPTASLPVVGLAAAVALFDAAHRLAASARRGQPVTR
ncbi:MAG: hypothetical protein R2761_13340 [Acidimicrobiales bacterium]